MNINRYFFMMLNIFIFQISHNTEQWTFINFDWVSVCLFVYLYLINVKTAQPIGPNFFWGPWMTPALRFIGLTLSSWNCWEFSQLLLKPNATYNKCFTVLKCTWKGPATEQWVRAVKSKLRALRRFKVSPVLKIN